jgi:exopolysaccharide biosynthesis protein
MSKTYKARVREIRESGNTKLAAAIMVLSIGPTFTGSTSKVKTGAVLTISTACSPNLQGAKTAIGGGPVLVRNGKRQKLTRPTTESYEFSSMMERHPRTAVGWNKSHFFLVEVDGRQKNLSVGMTLDELSAYLAKLGCDEAINLDGGGSATLWCTGSVRNSPCDGQERAIANSLIVVKRRSSKVQKPSAAPAKSAVPP